MKKKVEFSKLKLNKIKIAPLTTEQIERIKGGDLTRTIQNGGTSLAVEAVCTGR
jgi:hypothetical protein